MGIKIEKIKATLPVYDATVEKNHNFFANGILVHNCAEIVEYTDEVTTAICNLASIVLKNFIINGKFDFDMLYAHVRKITRRLNKVIDINHYATEKGRKGGLEQRAIAIGIQGLADTFYLLDLTYSSPEAKELNKKIFETIYFAALTESCDLVEKGIQPKYQFFDGSPLSEGKFQFNLWGLEDSDTSGLWDWASLREKIVKVGVCNSLVTAGMPTASSAKITASYEKDEPMDSNLFNRRVLGGEFVIANPYLITDLEKIGLWSEQLKNEILVNNGSIQNVNFQQYLDSDDKKYESKVARIDYLMKKYRTVWEHPQRELIDMHVDRAPYVDQTQSMNVYFADPTVSKLTSSHMYAWKKGLKTGCYYVRSKAAGEGAKHLAIDTQKVEIKYSKPEEPKFKERPADSMFECTGCDA
jgi:ribonucleoside-diphosphate reductase alpha chain